MNSWISLLIKIVSFAILNVFKFVTLILLSSISFIIEAALEMSKTNRKRKEGHTVIERNSISPNWQAFLQNQQQQNKSITSHKKEIQREVNGYYKALREDNLRNKMTTGLLNNNKAPQRNKDGSPVLTRYVAMDCEMVGIGEKGLDHMIARVSIVNKFGDCLYDKFVQPREQVVDYRTSVSGVRKEDMLNGERFEVVQKEVSEILNGRFLVGHSIKHDLDVLFLSHPASKIRDTSKYKPFRSITKGKTPSLKKLSEMILSVDIQKGEHSSVEDARATMQLYSLHAHNWEEMISKKRQKRRNYKS